jgi:hypothetical protein
MAVSGLTLPRPHFFFSSEIITHEFGSVVFRDRYLS